MFRAIGQAERRATDRGEIRDTIQETLWRTALSPFSPGPIVETGQLINLLPAKSFCSTICEIWRKL
jgi:hypothetical protein